jgi:translation initiation factor 2 subunit 2
MSDEELQFDFGKKKSKKSKKVASKTAVEEASGSSGFVPGPVYSYEDLLYRLHDLINANNPDVSKKGHVTLRPPVVQRVGSKKVAFVNFGDLCNSLNRAHDHVFQYFMTELGTTGSITAENAMVIKGVYQPKQIESLLRKYIQEYVQCGMCKSAKTTFERDAAARLSTINCSNCGASRTVHAIKSGFHATTKADRRAERALV